MNLAEKHKRWGFDKMMSFIKLENKIEYNISHVVLIQKNFRRFLAIRKADDLRMEKEMKRTR